jgi:hypothetical protein
LDQDFLTLEFMQVVEGVELGQVQEEILLQELVEREEVVQVQVELLMQQQEQQIQVVVEQDFLQDLLHIILLLVKLWEDLVDLEVGLEVVDLLIFLVLLVQLLEQEDQEILLL